MHAHVARPELISIVTATRARPAHDGQGAYPRVHTAESVKSAAETSCVKTNKTDHACRIGKCRVPGECSALYVVSLCRVIGGHATPQACSWSE